MVFEKVAQILAENRGIDVGEITPETTLEALGLDSLDTVELVMSFEDEFGVSIEMQEGIKTVEDVVKILEKAGA